MGRKRNTPEQIIGKLREAGALGAGGALETPLLPCQATQCATTSAGGDPAGRAWLRFPPPAPPDWGETIIHFKRA